MRSLPLPKIQNYNEPFFEAAKEDRLKIQFCNNCNKFVFYPRTNCPHCLRTDKLTWEEASGKGKLYSFAIVHRPQHEAFFSQVPITLAAVELQEGPVMISRIIQENKNDDVFIGMELKVQGYKMTENIYVPVFIPIG